MFFRFVLSEDAFLNVSAVFWVCVIGAGLNKNGSLKKKIKKSLMANSHTLLVFACK